MIACFYVPTIGLAVEKERMPDLTGHPLALTQDSILTAVSPEAARFGVKPGQKASGAQALCGDLALLPYDKESYERAARPMWNLCAIESSIVEPISPESCFLELCGRDQEQRARMLLADIAACTPAAVYCGLSRSKFVAQQAAAREIVERFLFVAPGAESAFLDGVAVPAAMLDKKTGDRLERLGIRTLGDVRRLPPGELERQARQYAVRLRRLAVGHDTDEVRALWPPRTIDHEFDFDEEVSDSSRIEHALLCGCIHIAHRLGCEYARTVRLTAHRSDRSKRSQSQRLALPISTTADLYLVSLRLLKRLSLNYAVTGIRLSVRDVSIASGTQLRLLDDNQHMAGLPHERNAALETTRGFLNGRYGKHALEMASAHARPQQVSLTLAPLGRRSAQQIEVTTHNGAPICFSHHNRHHQITAVLDRWKHIECRGDSVTEFSSFRVIYGVCAIADLEQSSAGWRLVSVSD